MMMKKKTPHDFKFVKLLGEGSFSSVYLAVDAKITSASLASQNDTKSDQLSSAQNESGVDIESDSSEASTATTTNKIVDKLSNQESAPATNVDYNKRKIPKYAIKVCQKSYIKRQNKQAAIMREKEIMNVLNQHPNKHFIKLHYTFQDLDRLYFVMTYADNGELLNYMLENKLTLNLVRKYTLQLVTALEHLHNLNIVHRDLKPENILLNSEMDILITDFGSAQIYLDNSGEADKNGNDGANLATADRRNSFVGTAQYVSPEMLKNRQASNKSDLWALGVIIYQMITNIMPFNAPNEYLIYQKIQNLDYGYPEDFDPTACDLVKSIIKLEPDERLGANDNIKHDGYISIRRHPFLLSENGEGSIHELKLLSCSGSRNDLNMTEIDKIAPGLDESQLLRLLTVG